MTYALVPIVVDVDGAAAVTGLSVSTIESLERADDFPKRRRLSDRRTGFLYAELVQWAQGRPLSNLAPPPNTGARKTSRSRSTP